MKLEAMTISDYKNKIPSGNLAYYREKQGIRSQKEAIPIEQAKKKKISGLNILI